MLFGRRKKGEKEGNNGDKNIIEVVILIAGKEKEEFFPKLGD